MTPDENYLLMRQQYKWDATTQWYCSCLRIFCYEQAVMYIAVCICSWVPFTCSWEGVELLSCVPWIYSNNRKQKSPLTRQFCCETYRPTPTPQTWCSFSERRVPVVQGTQLWGSPGVVEWTRSTVRWPQVNARLSGFCPTTDRHSSSALAGGHRALCDIAHKLLISLSSCMYIKSPCKCSYADTPVHT